MKTFKILVSTIAVTGLLLGANSSWAKKKSELKPTVKGDLIATFQEVSNESDYLGYETSNSFLNRCNQTKIHLDARYYEIRDAITYECSKVTLNYSASYQHVKGSSYASVIRLEVFCISRDLFSKQLYTAALNCENNPQEFCWSDTFRKQLESFKQTEFQVVWAKTCEGVLD